MDPAPDRRMTQMDEQIALPHLNGELVFAAPWEARAFGIAVALHDHGMYAWRDFSQGLAAATAAEEQQRTSAPYYERWLTTLEKLALAKGLITPEELQRRIAEYVAGLHDDHHDHDHHEHDHR